MTIVLKVPGHSKYRHSTKFPVSPLELPRMLLQIPSVLDTQNTESVKPQVAQTLNTINTWQYAVGDCVTILAVYKTNLL